MYKTIKIKIENLELSKEKKVRIFEEISEGQNNGSIEIEKENYFWILTEGSLLFEKRINIKRDAMLLKDEEFSLKIDKWNNYVIDEMKDSHIINTLRFIEKRRDVLEAKSLFVKELESFKSKYADSILVYISLLQEACDRKLPIAQDYLMETEHRDYDCDDEDDYPSDLYYNE